MASLTARLKATLQKLSPLSDYTYDDILKANDLAVELSGAGIDPKELIERIDFLTEPAQKKVWMINEIRRMFK